MRFILQDLFTIQICVSLSYDLLCGAVQVKYTMPSWNILGCVFFWCVYFEYSYSHIYDKAKKKMQMLRAG